MLFNHSFSHTLEGGIQVTQIQSGHASQCGKIHGMESNCMQVKFIPLLH